MYIMFLMEQFFVPQFIYHYVDARQGVVLTATIRDPRAHGWTGTMRCTCSRALYRARKCAFARPAPLPNSPLPSPIPSHSRASPTRSLSLSPPDAQSASKCTAMV